MTWSFITTYWHIDFQKLFNLACQIWVMYGSRNLCEQLFSLMEGGLRERERERQTDRRFNIMINTYKLVINNESCITSTF
jgi:hypothetical protein